MDDAFLVKIGEAAYNLSKQDSAIKLLNVLVAVDEGDQITTRGKLCEDIQRVGRNNGVNVGQDVGMFELSEDVNLLELPVNLFARHLAILLAQGDDLANQLPLGLGFDGQVDSSLCTAAEASWGNEILILKNPAFFCLDSRQRLGRRLSRLEEEKLPVRLNLDDIAIFQEISRRDLWTTADELAVDKCSVGGLAIPDVDVVD